MSEIRFVSQTYCCWKLAAIISPLACSWYASAPLSWNLCLYLLPPMYNTDTLIPEVCWLSPLTFHVLPGCDEQIVISLGKIWIPCCPWMPLMMFLWKKYGAAQRYVHHNWLSLFIHACSILPCILRNILEINPYLHILFSSRFPDVEDKMISDCGKNTMLCHIIITNTCNLSLWLWQGHNASACHIHISAIYTWMYLWVVKT